MEPSLDELLADEIMEHMTRSDGLSVRELRAQLRELARRLGQSREPATGCHCAEA